MGRLVYSKVLICHEEAVCWQAVNHVTSREQYAERQDNDVEKGCYVFTTYCRMQDSKTSVFDRRMNSFSQEFCWFDHESSSSKNAPGNLKLPGAFFDELD